MEVSPEEANLLSIMHSAWKQRCICVAIDLKIPELLCNSSKPSMNIDDIAAKSHCESSEQLLAVMRLLAKCGIGKELEKRHFAKNKALELLRRDHGPSVGHLFGYHASDEHFSALSSLGACVKGGEPAFVLEHGMNHFDYLYDSEKPYDKEKMFDGSSEYKIGSDERRKEFAENYASGMSYFTYLITLPDKQRIKTVYNSYPWSTCHKVVDIGGSTGFFLASIMKLPGCEHIQGYVMELPEMVDHAQKNIQDLGIAQHRIGFVKQDFTKPLSTDINLQVDTIVFKNTLCVYMNDHATMSKILENCCKLFGIQGGRLLIIDSCVPGMEDEKQNDVGVNGIEMVSFAVHWLSIIGNRMYTKKEWIENLNAVGNKLGYELQNVYDTFVGGNVIFELSYNMK